MEDRLIVVDDDPIILKEAWNILNGTGTKVIPIKSGKTLFDYLDKNPAPDLILLDVRMPDMDGFEVIEALRARKTADRDTPVIFLTATEDEAMEAKGLKLGAMDYIRKPFTASVLPIRIRHAIDLVRLQKDLATEVEKKSRENEQLFIHVVTCLAEAIDAKDAYTKGHSGRVAEYSKEIAARYGYSEKMQDDIYMIGLLHDVGKIGVPDSIINKPGHLTDEEFEVIKTHPGIGGRILEAIKEMPLLSSGARWHHERYDGTGYPDSLAGENIPEAARIISVADAYDAMTSNRSYRRSLSQETVRNEIEKGKGSQFDPLFADIMIGMIDEDREYSMRDTRILHS